ncbi:MAG: hypothetical protein K0Q49_2564 [Haloplasmataceae bacterium]|jgi:hypothetical protein|nr:hypothetical protein [Haloplasmataceae bacterium]
MVKFDLIYLLNNKININENSLEITTVLTKYGLKNVATVDNLIIFDNNEINVTINANICSFNIKNEADWKHFFEYSSLFSEIIKCLSSTNFSPMINLRLIKISETNNNIFEISKSKLKFNHEDDSPINNAFGVGFRFFEISEFYPDILNEYKIEPYLNNSKFLYVEANYFYKELTKMNENNYADFERKIKYFFDQYK